jgi:hypothetical protein
MAAEQIAGEQTSIVVTYPVTPQDIEAKRAEFAALSFDTGKDYAAGVQAIAHCRRTRVQIEERRKYLKADSLAYGRAVDRAAKELTALVESIEEPLKLKKGVVDDAKERAKREAAEAERRAMEEQLRAEREAEEARLRAERQAEEERLRVERERLAAERAELAEQRRKEDEARAVEAERLMAERRAQDAAIRAERAKLDEERKALEAERVRAEAAERAKAQAERDRVAAEQARLAELERQAEHARKLAELAPDLDKLRAFAASIRALPYPSCTSATAAVQLMSAVGRLARAADGLEAFCAQGESC